MKALWNEPVVKFLVIGFVLYIAWLGIYEWWLHPAKWADALVIDNTISISRLLLGWMGYETEVSGPRILRIPGTPGLYIGDSCNGLSLFALYTIFLLAFPGKVMSKAVFIPVGILLIHLLNVLRVVVLAIMISYSYTWTEFNHTYTFTILIYACIFGLWWYWISKFSSVKKKQAA